MKKLAGALLLLSALLAPAAVINVEFKFTPFIGDPEKETEVTTIPGKAQVFVNNVPLLEQEVRADKLPVLIDQHEVSPAVWVPVSSMGPAVRKGKNKIRIEFTPNDAAIAYQAQLGWIAVTDETAEANGPGAPGLTNPANEGVDNRKAPRGKVTFEREFTADFALDLPWHHYPAVTNLTEEDKQQIAALLRKRAAWFQPDFAALYKAVEENETLKVDDVRQAKCLEAAYKAGVRVAAPEAGELEFDPTGGPEVIVRRKTGSLFGLDEKTFARLKDEEVVMCSGMVLSVIYPGRLVAVRKPQDGWQIVY